MKFVIIFILILSTNNLLAQYKVEGRLEDNNGKAIEFANVGIENTTWGTTTNEKGEFSLEISEAGTYQLIISVVGYVRNSQIIMLNENQKVVQLGTVEMEATEELLEAIEVTDNSVAYELTTQSLQVTSVDMKEFQLQSSNVVGVLDRSAGIRVRQSGALGSDVNIQLNGLTGRAVRIYYDGIPLDLIGGGLNLNQLPVNSIQRVDVYKGVMPIDIGTDALAGGINIVPVQLNTTYLETTYSYGSFNTHVATLNAGKVFDNGVSVGINSFINYSDNNYRMKVQNLIPEEFREEEIEVERFHNQFQSALIQAKIGIYDKSWIDELSYTAIYNYQTNEIQHGVRLSNQPAGEVETRDDTFVQYIRFKKKFLNEKLSLNYFGSLAFSWNEVKDSTLNQYNWRGEIIANDSQSGSELLFAPSLRKGTNTTTAHRLTFTYNLHPNHQIKASHFLAYNEIEGEDPAIAEDFVDPNTVPSSLSRNISGISYEGKFWKEKIKTLFFGKYYQYSNSSFEPTFGGSALAETAASGEDFGFGTGLKFEIRPDFFIRASYEQAIRIPDDFEFFGDFITIRSNPSLRPEQSNNLNLGIFYRLDWSLEQFFSVDMNFFLRDQSDLIRLEPNPNPTQPGQYINEDKADSQGIEFVLRTQPFKGFGFDVNFTYQEVLRGGEENINQTNGVGDPIPNIPTLFFSVATRYDFQSPFKKEHRLSVYSYFNFVDEFSVVTEGGDINRDGNFVPVQNQLDLGLTYSLDNPNLSFTFQTNNILDAEVFDNFRVPKPGRAYSFKIRYFLK